jgi:hypothetical protein
VLENSHFTSATRMRNPYKQPLLVRAFDGALRAYAEHNKSLFAANGRENRQNWAGAAFWAGFHGEPAAAQPGSQKYAVYRAGVAAARLSAPRPARRTLDTEEPN